METSAAYRMSANEAEIRIVTAKDGGRLILPNRFLPGVLSFKLEESPRSFSADWATLQLIDVIETAPVVHAASPMLVGEYRIKQQNSRATGIADHRSVKIIPHRITIRLDQNVDHLALDPQP